MIIVGTGTMLQCCVGPCAAKAREPSASRSLWRHPEEVELPQRLSALTGSPKQAQNKPFHPHSSRCYQMIHFLDSGYCRLVADLLRCVGSIARLMELEDERQSFLDEGVYDVVNSICGCVLSGCATNGNQPWYE